MTNIAGFDWWIADDSPLWAQIAYTGLVTADHWQFSRRPPYEAQRDIWALLVPYCVHPTRRPDVYCVVNRDYHALGCASWTNYDKAELWHVDQAEHDRLLLRKVIDKRGYLYDDRDAPYGVGAQRVHLEPYLEKLRAMLAPWRRDRKEPQVFTEASPP